jgi:hypothetical protein
LVVISITSKADIDGMQFNSRLSKSSSLEIRMMLSDLLIGQIEDWAVSESLFARFPPGLERLISSAKHNNSKFHLSHGIDIFRTNDV